MKNNLVLAGIGMILMTALAMTSYAANKTNQIKSKTSGGGQVVGID